MEDDKIECVNCGGTDFTKEGGYFFCTECHTQSQEIQERVYDFNDTVPVVQKQVKIQKEPSEKDQNKLTSWEIYNYILHGLVGELQDLGVDESFKEIVYHLWITYLTKLEYLSVDSSLPKLGIAYRKRDAEIVYKRKAKRKRKGSTISKMSVNDMDERMKFAEKTKKRRMMERAEYDSLSTTIKSETTSLANQTLSGLSSEEESSIAGQIAYNKRSVKELLRHMSYYHLTLHMKDVDNEMTCHQLAGSKAPEAFYRGPEVLTRNKLYCVLYLALLLTQQDLQISDVIRYCREGHLSFLEYDHFFPDDVNDASIDHSVYSKGEKVFPSFEFIRSFTFRLYKFLDLRPCDFSPNILRLCRRYCTELNLPDQFYNIAGDFIVNSRPFHTKTKLKFLPNYEGRAMGFIIYVFKLLLGIDDVTEYELSKFARLVNNKNEENSETEELFSFSDWFSYIEYRKIVLKHVHFPTWQLLHPNKDCPIDLYVKYTYFKKDHYEKEPSDLTMSVAKKMLTDIELLQVDQNEELIKFEPSPTPNRSYLDKLQSINNFKVLDQPLNLKLIKDASKQTVEYLIDPQKYFKLINAEKCSIIFNNANSNHKFSRIRSDLGEFFLQTYDHWEKKWNDDFTIVKSEQLAFDTLMNKILNKHIQNCENGTNLDLIKQTKPELIYPPVDIKFEHIRQSVGRNARGRFCKKSDPKALSPENIKPVNKSQWHVSSWNRAPLKSEYNPSLLYQVKTDEEMKAELQSDTLQQIKESEKIKHLNRKSKYKYHYIPRMEYCANFKDVSYLTKEKYKEFESTLPKNFQWLLTECARIIEQPTKELFQEFVNVEIYMNYIYFKRLPVPSKPLSNRKAIHKMIKQVKENW